MANGLFHSLRPGLCRAVSRKCCNAALQIARGLPQAAKADPYFNAFDAGRAAP
jgi:hypothetical protein